CPFRLNGGVPVPAFQRYGDVFRRAFDLSGVEVVDPADFGQINALVAELEPLWIPKAVTNAFALETRHAFVWLLFIEAVGERAAQILQRLLQSLRVGLFEKSPFIALLP